MAIRMNIRIFIDWLKKKSGKQVIIQKTNRQLM